ncbi:uncharacterized protein LOC132728537 [Ruditapes philippinarum]|uniref:uncharacterized protein LOC132728537 n=1 Tax=Ruditapes philippinarum TaxID=129788 RepID=UPI00295C2FB3|nr:uncharacterized protein LOC132728537 [Ruditapes philippinarum]XP_060570161.1 uncharacterized protein LOC132728537 [Ruditapes philippinarum]
MENIDRQKKKLRIGLMFDCDVGGQLHRHSTRSELMSCRRNEEEKADNRTFQLEMLAKQLEMKKLDKNMEEMKLNTEKIRHDSLKLEIEKEHCINQNIEKSKINYVNAQAYAENARRNAEVERTAAETARARADEAKFEQIKLLMTMNRGSAEVPGIMHAHDELQANMLSSFSSI